MWYQSRSHGGRLGVLAPPNEASSPPNWNMKYYKSVDFLLIFWVSNPPHKPKPPLQKCKTPYWKLSGDGSVWYHRKSVTFPGNLDTLGSRSEMNKIFWTKIFGAAITQGQTVCLSIGRWGVQSTATEWISVAILGKERSPQPPQQEAQFRLRPAANCRHQN